MKHTFTCKRGDFTIRGTEFLPKGENLPIVIVSHEFLCGQYTVWRYAKKFAEWGYAAFCYDFVGGAVLGRSDGKHTDMTVFSEMEDLKAVFAYARAHPKTDAGRVYLMGCSQGGLVSALTAAELGDEIAGLMLFYPALSVPDDARAGNMIFNTKFDPTQVPNTIRCGPFTFSGSYPETVMGLDVFETIPRYPGPVFLAHGTEDGIVDYQYAKKAQTAYGSERCTLMTIPGAGHIFKPVEDAPAVAGLRHFLAGRREVLTIDVKLTKISPELHGLESILTIPFTGIASGDLFTGTILPGAVDVQKRSGLKVQRLCATYTLEGKDYTGAPCRIDIQNVDTGDGWKPTVKTDSEALAFLNERECFAHVQNRVKGPLVRIFA